MDIVILNDLPRGHALRRMNLWSLGAQTREKASPEDGWKPLGQYFKVAHCSFDQLGPRWHSAYEWRATQ